MRVFESGATRDSDEGKIDYAGCLSPYAQRAFGEYMLAHQVQPDGSRRDSRNWQKGIPMPAYISSAARHWHEVWEAYERTGAPTVEALCALMFNVQGMLHELRKPFATDVREVIAERYRTSHVPATISWPDPDGPAQVTLVADATVKDSIYCGAESRDGRQCWYVHHHTNPKHSWESF